MVEKENTVKKAEKVRIYQSDTTDLKSALQARGKVSGEDGRFFSEKTIVVNDHLQPSVEVDDELLEIEEVIGMTDQVNPKKG